MRNSVFGETFGGGNAHYAIFKQIR